MLTPKATIKTEGSESFAFVVRGDGVERRAVKLGQADGDRVEVLAGLQAGDRVVLSPPIDLTAASKIVVK
jgi:multidrug efflux pump subunit AcrA (membrane-fusion protein)